MFATLGPAGRAGLVVLALALPPAVASAAPATAADASPTAMAETLSCTSSDGHWHLTARGPTLSLLDAQGALQRTWPVADRAGRVGQVLALADHPARRSFIVALKGLNEVWELSYDPRAEPIFDGLVHDYRMGEGLARPGFLGLRRMPLAAEVLGIEVDGRHPWVLIHQAGGTAVLHLDVRRIIPRAPSPGAQVPQGPGR